jgi:hypothetical protein
MVGQTHQQQILRMCTGLKMNEREEDEWRSDRQSSDPVEAP